MAITLDYPKENHNSIRVTSQVREYIIVKGKNKKTGQIGILIYNEMPCLCRLKRHFADFIGDDLPENWEVIGSIVRKGLRFEAIRHWIEKGVENG